MSLKHVKIIGGLLHDILIQAPFRNLLFLKFLSICGVCLTGKSRDRMNKSKKRNNQISNSKYPGTPTPPLRQVDINAGGALRSSRSSHVNRTGKNCFGVSNGLDYRHKSIILTGFYFPVSCYIRIDTASHDGFHDRPDNDFM